MSEREPGHVRWFGPAWGAPINDPLYEDPTPVGLCCLHCGMGIVDGERGLIMSYAADGAADCAYHLTCMAKEIGGEPRSMRRPPPTPPMPLPSPRVVKGSD